MQRMLIVISSLVLPACDPPPKDAGEVESSTGSSESSTGEIDTEGNSTGDPGMDVEWSMDLDQGTTIVQMIRSSNGVVLTLQSDPSAPSATVMEVSSSMDLLWSIDLPGASVSDLAPLDDGTYVMGGIGVSGGAIVPMAWHLSCCGSIEQSMDFPGLGNPSAITVSQPLADGVLLAVTDGTDSELIRTTPQLATQWSMPWPGRVDVGAPTSAGTVVLAVSGGGNDTEILEVSGDGPGVGHSDGQIQTPVGSGDGMVLMTAGFEQVWFEPFGGGAVVPVSLPGFESFEYIADRRDRFGLMFGVTEEAGSTTHVAEFEADGSVLREVILPPTTHDYLSPSAIAVGTDDAIYVGAYEVAPEAPVLPRLLRLAPR